jgi:hypothetical protein
MIELSMETVAVPLTPTPPPPVADAGPVLPMTVLFRMVTVPVTLEMPIPPPPFVLAVELPKKVLFSIVTPVVPTVPKKTSPPPWNELVDVPTLPDTVVFCINRLPPLKKYTPPVPPEFPEMVEFWMVKRPVCPLGM